MPLHDFRSVYFPYCLDKQPDGRYLVLNREYKPLGFNDGQHVDYAAFPIAARLRISASTARKVSHNSNPDTDRIFLYDDGCHPARSPKHLDSYLKRLSYLSNLKVK